jgi:hypothetical protein
MHFTPGTRVSSGRFSPSARAVRIALLAVALAAPARAWAQVATCPVFAAEAVYAADIYPSSLAIGDVNADGKPDLVVANGTASSVSILLGNGDGTVRPAVHYSSGAFTAFAVAVAIGDVNGDAKPDVVVANRDANSVAILLGNGDGTFGAAASFSVGNAPYAVAIGDVNGDGKADLAVANSNSNTVSILLGNGNGTFAAAVHYAVQLTPMSIAIGDVSGDGKPDLAVANGNSSSVSILLGNGNGTFAAAVHYGVGSGPISIAIGDVSGDAKPDLAVANQLSNTVSILLGNGNGTFATAVSYGAAGDPFSVALGDVNGDGKLDVAVLNAASTSVSILPGNGTGGFGTPINSVAGTTARSLALGDISGDGKLDVAVADTLSDTVSIVLGNGDGTFARAAVNYGIGGSSFSIAMGDVNGDGKRDLVVPNWNSSVVGVLLGNGNGTFGPAVSWGADSGADSVAIGDVNGDGKADLAVGNYYSHNVSILLGNGNGTFALAVNYSLGASNSIPVALTLADVNGDGALDLAVATAGSGVVAILLGNGNGSFAAPVNYGFGGSGAGPESVTVGDVNGDGKPDLAVATSFSNTVSILLGNGNGTFGLAVNYPVGAAPWSVAIGDMNGDGHADVAVANSGSNSVSILLGNGTGTFFAGAVNYATGFSPRSVVMGDINGDGKPDLAVANANSNSVSILLGNGTGTVAPATNYRVGAVPYLVAMGDLNGDGKLDLAFSNTGSANVSVLLNTSCSTVPTVTADRTSLAFSAVSNGAAFSSKTSDQTVRMTQTGTGAATWTAVSTRPWLVVSPTSGTGPATINISVQFAPGLAATQAGAVTLTFTGASNTAGPITVTLNTLATGTSAAPVGSFDTPLTGTTGIAGSVAVTGWALDDVAVTRVRIARDPVGAETPGAQVFVGDAIFIDGARPDVQAGSPGTPLNTRAGWGYLMLTNFLPAGGTGTFTLYAYADDADGHTTLLGSKTITCANATSIAPFGAIDTPGQGEVIGGAVYLNFGWALSPGTRHADVPGGGAVSVFVDGVNLGTPQGWGARSDITTLFPKAQYDGTDRAVAALVLNTTTLANGAHTIFWVATATSGGTSGIGSRFFSVSNGSGLFADPAVRVTTNVIAAPAALAVPMAAAQRLGGSAVSLLQEVDGARADRSTIAGRRGFDPDTPLVRYGYKDGGITMHAEELDRIELRLSEDGRHQYTGYLRTVAGMTPLPIGSTLDAATGAFTWMPGPGFVGGYDLAFVRWSDGRAVARQDVRIVLNPKGSLRVGTHVVIDIPAPGAQGNSPVVVRRAFFLAGWAADLDAGFDRGVDTVHVWAYPVNDRGEREQPSFLGPAIYGGARPDVAAAYGARFHDTGYNMIVQDLAPGTYDVAVFAFSTVMGDFAPAKVVRVIVR